MVVTVNKLKIDSIVHLFPSLEAEVSPTFVHYMATVLTGL